MKILQLAITLTILASCNSQPKISYNAVTQAMEQFRAKTGAYPENENPLFFQSIIPFLEDIPGFEWM